MAHRTMLVVQNDPHYVQHVVVGLHRVGDRAHDGASDRPHVVKYLQCSDHSNLRVFTLKTVRTDHNI